MTGAGDRRLDAAAVAVLFDHGEQHRRIDRLREIAVHARGQTPLAIAVHRVRGHGDNADVLARGALAQANRDGRVEAAHDRHLQVHQHEVERLAIEPRQRLTAVLGDRHVMAAAGQQAGRDPLVDHVVLDEQDADAPAVGAHRPARRPSMSPRGGAAADGFEPIARSIAASRSAA